MAATSSALPLLDEHSIVVGAPAPETWCAAAAFFDAPLNPVSRRYARLVGVRGDNPFEVESAKPPDYLEVAGEHRFARYAIVFTTERLGPGSTRLTMRSLAEFPGAGGRLYRTAVVGTRFHVLAVRWMLRRIARSAVRTSSRSS